MIVLPYQALRRSYDGAIFDLIVTTTFLCAINLHFSKYDDRQESYITLQSNTKTGKYYLKEQQSLNRGIKYKTKTYDKATGIRYNVRQGEKGETMK